MWVFRGVAMSEQCFGRGCAQFAGYRVICYERQRDMAEFKTNDVSFI